jgi:hypothetical protein
MHCFFDEMHYFIYFSIQSSYTPFNHEMDRFVDFFNKKRGFFRPTTCFFNN